MVAQRRSPMPKLDGLRQVCIVLALWGTIVGTLQGQKLKTLANLDSATGGNILNLNVPLVQSPDGDLYGTTQQGGVNGAGTIYKVSAEGKLTTLYAFCSKP